MAKSIESEVTLWANEQLNKGYYDLYLENGCYSNEIEEIFKQEDSLSKSGGNGVPRLMLISY